MEINLECKFNKYAQFSTTGTYKTDSSENPFLKDKFFKINFNNKKLQELDTVINEWELIKDISWSNDIIEWKVEYDFGDKNVFYHEIKR